MILANRVYQGTADSSKCTNRLFQLLKYTLTEHKNIDFFCDFLLTDESIYK